MIPLRQLKCIRPFLRTYSSVTTDAIPAEPSSASSGGSFYSQYMSLRERLDLRKTPSPASLRSLAALITSPADAKLFTDALARWRRHQPAPLPQDSADNAIFRSALTKVNAHSSLLKLALNPYKYGMYLSSSEMHELMVCLSEQYVKGAQGDEEAEQPGNLEVLDDLYKAFALFIHSNNAPTPELYIPLITAGAYLVKKQEGGKDEGWDRAIISFHEAEWLFSGPPSARGRPVSAPLSLPPIIYNSVIYGYLSRGMHKKALTVLQKCLKLPAGSTLVHPRLQYETLVMSKQLKEAVEYLTNNQNLAAYKIENAAIAAGLVYGKESWTPVEKVHDILLDKIKTRGDEDLYGKLTLMIGQ